MNKTFYFMGGLPRSGSTLLCNILNQNPFFHATQTSGLLQTMMQIKNGWNTTQEHVVTPNDTGLKRVLNGVIHNYYSNIEKLIVVDKCRGWAGEIEMIEHALDQRIKIICPVRDVRDVVASWELLWRKQKHKKQIPGEQNNIIDFQTLEGRVKHFTRNDSPIGIAYNKLKDAFDRGLGDRLHIVPFEKLTTSPNNTMRDIYNFLEEDFYEHNFNYVEQVTSEDDRLWGFEDLHTIRNKVEAISPRYPSVLGETAKQFENLNFWEQR